MPDICLRKSLIPYFWMFEEYIQKVSLFACPLFDVSWAGTISHCQGQETGLEEYLILISRASFALPLYKFHIALASLLFLEFSFHFLEDWCI